MSFKVKYEEQEPESSGFFSGGTVLRLSVRDSDNIHQIIKVNNTEDLKNYEFGRMLIEMGEFFLNKGFKHEKP